MHLKERLEPSDVVGVFQKPTVPNKINKTPDRRRTYSSGILPGNTAGFTQIVIDVDFNITLSACAVPSFESLNLFI